VVAGLAVADAFPFSFRLRREQIQIFPAMSASKRSASLRSSFRWSHFLECDPAPPRVHYICAFSSFSRSRTFLPLKSCPRNSPTARRTLGKKLGCHMSVSPGFTPPFAPMVSFCFSSFRALLRGYFRLAVLRQFGFFGRIFGLGLPSAFFSGRMKVQVRSRRLHDSPDQVPFRSL